MSGRPSKNVKKPSKRWKNPDAANDEMFGSLGDLKGGLPSTAGWEAQHQAHAREREAEKASYLTKQDAVEALHSHNPKREFKQHVQHVNGESQFPKPQFVATSLFPQGYVTNHAPRSPQRPHSILHNLTSSEHDAGVREGHPYSAQSYRLHQHVGTHENVSPARYEDSGIYLPLPLRSHAVNAQAPFSPHVPSSRLSPKRSILPNSTRDRAGGTGRGLQQVLPNLLSEKGEIEDQVQDQSPPPRQLESMTEKDLGFILRMHLKQLEATDSYRDDYYHYATQEQQRLKTTSTFDVLAVKVQAAQSSAMLQAEFARRRRKIQSMTNGVDDAKDITVNERHTTQNIETLSKALGTLQMRTPKAPRKLMDYGHSSEDLVIDKSEAARGKGSGPSAPLLAEDDRVLVRAKVEKGYDIIAQIHDTIREKSHNSLAQCVADLYSVFCVKQGVGERPVLVPEMCSFAKGTKFILRSLPLLSPVDRNNVIFGITGSLCRLIRRSRVAGEDFDTENRLLVALERYGTEDANKEQLCGLLVAFMHGHSDDTGDLVDVLSNARGAKLFSSILQKLYAKVKEDVHDMESVNSVMSIFCATVAPHLAQVFEQSERHESIWSLVAMLDALSPETQRVQLRGVLKDLLDKGKVKPPGSE